jgi:hypothetical protein
VNGHQFESTFCEAIFLSPAIEELMLNDFGPRKFLFPILELVAMIFQFF